MDKLALYTYKSGFNVTRYSDHITMLKNEKPDVTIVACYFYDHAKVSIDALSMGSNVFSEKPYATNMEDLIRLREVCRKTGKSIGAMFCIRYTSSFLTAKDLVDEGVIGKIRLMNAQKSYKLGERAEFFKRRDTYGGTIPWVGIHAIDWFYWFGKQEFLSVFASHSTMHNRDHGELEVSAICHFSFTNEVIGSVSIDYLRLQNAPTHADDRIRIVGTKGILEIRNKQVFLINENEDGKKEIPQVTKKYIFEDFVRNIGEYSYREKLFEDGFIVTKASLLARLSADTKKPVFFNSLV